jgi:hypothetical protein
MRKGESRDQRAWGIAPSGVVEWEIEGRGEGKESAALWERFTLGAALRPRY